MQTDTLFKNLNNIPLELLLGLKQLLQNKEKYEILENQLETTPILIENDNYQISINSIHELKGLKLYLIENYSEDRASA